MPAVQDYKRVFDGDKGPNTGGVGCHAPVKFATPSVMYEIETLIIKPTLDGLREEGMFLSFGRPIFPLAARLRLFRYSFRWHAIHRSHAHQIRTQMPRIQRQIW